MIEYIDNQWWINERSTKSEGKGHKEMSDSDYFQIELLKIEEALTNISRLIRKYMVDQ